jgi:hypothetical protein
MRRVSAFIGVVVLAITLISSAEVTAAVGPVFALRSGEEVFWDGPESISQAAFLPQLHPVVCENDIASCVDYSIDVLEPAARLRVGIDTADDPDFDNGEFLELYLYNPSGEQVAIDQPAYSGEVVALSPSPGRWVARVVAARASEATFWMRAKLEKRIPDRTGQNVLLPNLRLTPPFEFTFAAPATVFGPSLSDPRPAAQGCTADESVDYNPTRCLRFSIGPENIGSGHLELVYVAGDDPTGGTVIQRIHHADGSVSEREAGRYEYHATHAHYHHAAFASLELYRVLDEETGQMELAGTGPKVGFCMGDYLIVKWQSFENAPDRARLSECRGILDSPASGTRIGLTQGWADVYSYSLPGNYVDFGNNGPGRYVVRAKANYADTILESRADDNFSYSYFKVTRDQHGVDTIDVLERGYGRDPWDRPERIATDHRYVTAEQ